MRFIHCALLFLCLLSFSQVSVLRAEEDVAKIYTAIFPPIVTGDPNRPGYGYEIVERMFQLSGIQYKIDFVPWARAQMVVSATPETMVFPLTRTPTRENKFDWCMKLFNTQSHFVTLNGEKLTRESAYNRRIGVQLKSSWDNWLTENHYTEIHRMPEEGYDIVRMLLAQRLDGWYAERSVTQQILQDLKINYATFSEPIQIFETFLASNKEQPYKRIPELFTALKKMKETGEYQQIMKKYHL